MALASKAQLNAVQALPEEPGEEDEEIDSPGLCCRQAPLEHMTPTVPAMSDSVSKTE